MFNLLAGYAIDVAEPYLVWGTVAIAATLILAGAVIFFAKRAVFKSYAKTSVIAFVFYALVLGVVALTLEITKKYDVAYLEENWVNLDVINYVLAPLLALVSALLVSAIISFILAKKKPQSVKLASYILGSICGAGVIAAIVCIALYYTNVISDDGYYSTALNNVALYISAGALVVVTLVATFVLGKKDKKGFDTRCITIAGICVALSFALSYVKLFRLPQGGSITLVSMLPIMLFSYIYGVKKGVLVCFLYGVLQAVQDPWIIHPAQFLLDYPVAYTLVGFAGVFNIKKLDKLPQVKFCLGALLGGTLRYVSHLLSGVFAFGAYAIDAGSQNFLAYSAVYNSWLFIETAILIVVGAVIFSSKAFNKEIAKLNSTPVATIDKTALNETETASNATEDDGTTV